MNEITATEAQPGDKYVWFNVKGRKKVEETVTARLGNLVQVGPIRWVSLTPEQGRVVVYRG